jgi:nitrate/TMAO reductase-like tetraheme cytochrome c subunit
MKAFKLIICDGLVVVLCMLFFSQPTIVHSADNENHCFTCHTNPRKLIKITREISKLDTNKPGASKETKGEG